MFERVYRPDACRLARRVPARLGSFTNANFKTGVVISVFVKFTYAQHEYEINNKRV
jgi:hypothetical protein